MSKRKVLWITGLLLFFASAVRAQTGVNNAALKGDYAFSFNGMTTGDGVTSTPFAAVGRFTADGAGSLVNGELDANGFGAMEKAVAQPFTGRFTANGMGTFTNGGADVNLSGTFSTLNIFAGTYAVTDGATGRGILNMPPVAGGALGHTRLVRTTEVS